MKFLFTTFIGIMLITAVIAQQNKKHVVLFETNHYDLDSATREQLFKMIKPLKDKKAVQVKLSGHTDDVGTDEQNMILSEKRVQAVFNFFVANGLNKNSIITDHKGEKEPVSSNTTPADKRDNRRVEIVVVYENDKDKLLSFPVVKGSQLFHISANRDTVVTGKEGTIIHFYKNCFIDGRGETVKGNLTIELMEFYKMSDIIGNRLTTTSNREILETAGMIHIDAKQKNAPLRLREGTFYRVEFPAKTKHPEMGLYLGVKEGNQINWISPGEREGFDGWKPAAALNAKSKNKYIFDVNKLHWVNCDHYISWPNKARLQVELNLPDKVQLFIVLKKFRSVIAADQDYSFTNLPVGEKAVLVAVAPLGEKILYGKAEITTGANKVEKVTIMPLTNQQYEKELSLFDI